MYEQNKTLSGRGGRRIGASRPKGTTKTGNKRLITFRLSVEEEIAVKELLKKMRNK